MLLVLSLALAVTAPQDLPFELVVRDRAGGPVTGARVVLARRADWLFDPPVPLLEGATDADGCFAAGLPREWVEGASSDFLSIAVLGANGAAFDELPLDDVPIGLPIEWTLARAEPWSVVVRHANGEPASGAVVRVTSLGTSKGHGAQLPDVVREALSAEVGEGGAARITGVRREEVGALAVELPSGVVMNYRTPTLSTGWLGDEPLVLEELGTIQLALDADADPTVAGDAIGVTSFHGFDPDDPRAPSCEVVSQVTIPAPGDSVEIRLPRGARNIDARGGGVSLVPPTTVADMGVEFGSTMLLRTATPVPVTGRVVDAEGVGVAGVRVLLHSYPARSWVVTDDDGTFTWLAKAGPVSIDRVLPPRPYDELTMVRSLGRLEIPVGAAAYELPPVALSAATPIAGRVLQADGSPAAGALVTLRAEVGAGRIVERVVRRTVCDTTGAFVVHGPAGELSARFGRESTRDPVFAEDGVELRLSARVDLVGRVDLGERAGAVDVTIQVHEAPNEERGYEAEVVVPGGLRPGPGGAFRARGLLDPDAEYRLTVRAPGFVGQVGAWTSGRDLAAGVDLSLTPLGRVAGRLVDRDGAPRPGVRVFVRGDAPETLETVTGEDGGFAFEGVAPDGATAFADLGEEGFHARRFEPGAAPEPWRPIADEPGAARPLELERPHDRRLELDVASEVVEGRWRRARDEGDDYERLRALQGIARLDPARALAELERGAVIPDYVPIVERAIAERLVAESPDEALAIAQRQDSSYSSVMNLCRVADALPASEHARKLELLALARARLRRVQDPSHRLVLHGWLGERLTDLGEHELAEHILREGIPLAEDLPREEWAGFARASFAEELGRYDYETALRFIEESEPKEDRGRYFGNLAHELAAVNPAAAEELLGRQDFGQLFRPSRFVQRVVHDMAPVDLERALRLADLHDDSGFSHGMIALALAEPEPDAAREALHRAFAKLEECAVGDGRSNTLARPTTTGAALLAVVERVDPDHGRDWMNRVLALRAPAAELTEPRLAQRHAMSDGKLAFYLARYDREGARALLERGLPVLEAEDPAHLANDWSAWFAAAAVVDPEWAGVLAARFPGRGEAVVGAVLALEGEARRAFVQDEYMYLWIVGKEDL